MRAMSNLRLRHLLSPDLLLVTALFLVAFALRVYGVRGSLPYVGHPDEPKLIDSAIHIVKTGDLNPNLYIWPSLYIYLEALVVRVQTIWGMLRGYYTGPESLPDVTHIFTQAAGVYVWARTLTAAVGAAAVALLYVVGREMFNGSRRVGVVAALMLAVSPLHVEYSHYALTDVPLSLAGLLVLWASYRFSRTRPGGAGKPYSFFWPAVLCGLLVGIATGTKYNGLYLFVVPLTAWLMLRLRYRRSEGRALLVSLAALGGGAVLGFLLCEPYLILDWPQFYRGFTFQVEAYEPAETWEQMWASIVEHITNLRASDAYFFGPAILGAIVLIASSPYRNRAWLLIPFPIIYLLAMSRFSLTYVRNLLVTLPFLALICGFMVDLAATQLMAMLRVSVVQSPESKVPSPKSRVWSLPIRLWTRDFGLGTSFWGAARWVAVAIAVAFIVAEPLRVSTAYVGYMADPESRNLAWDWIRERMQQGDRFAAELHPWQTQEWPDVLSFDVENPGTQRPLTERPPEWYASHGYNYVVLNSNFRDEWRDEATWAEYEELAVEKVFAGDKDGGKGPTIAVLATGGQRTPPMLYTPRTLGLAPTLEDFAVLLGYDVWQIRSTNVLVDLATFPDTILNEEFKAGEAIGLNLYFRALRDGTSADSGWQVWVHLVDPASGGTVAQVDVAPLTGRLKNYPEIAQIPHPVPRWHAGEFVEGVYNLAIPLGLSPGTYRLEMGMWVPPNGPSARVSYPPGREPSSHSDPGGILLAEIGIR
jgi:4-amino-4-deoxy-L-arabinose transferase-like glycosyltransferase